MARLNICLLVVLMALSVCCDVVEEFSATEKDEGFTPADQYDQLQDEGISAAEMFEKLSAAADDKGVSPADQEDERSAKENDEGFSAAEKDMKFTAVENGDGVSVADEYDRGQCSANKDSQCSSGEEEKVGKRKVKSLYEMFEEGEDKHTPDEWIQSLANDKDFAKRLDEDVEFREKVEQELAELTAQNLADDLQGGEEG